ncbi:Hypothetical predicted protein [Olea europaea subsp. europaea]|uniref:Uncharacterized protein n=1 Tax=Olea europaea subsp. europaea TaxID=158383 RepID=A0A8S0QXZ9_OLEEU|nr:Hypothetical predicted protein [Olea europaea subsp. europaea]
MPWGEASLLYLVEAVMRLLREEAMPWEEVSLFYLVKAVMRLPREEAVPWGGVVRISAKVIYHVMEVEASDITNGSDVATIWTAQIFEIRQLKMCMFAFKKAHLLGYLVVDINHITRVSVVCLMNVFVLGGF